MQHSPIFSLIAACQSAESVPMEQIMMLFFPIKGKAKLEPARPVPRPSRLHGRFTWQESSRMACCYGHISETLAPPLEVSREYLEHLSLSVDEMIVSPGRQATERIGTPRNSKQPQQNVVIVLYKGLDFRLLLLRSRLCCWAFSVGLESGAYGRT
jgi:hypothetical protein